MGPAAYQEGGLLCMTLKQHTHALTCTKMQYHGPSPGGNRRGRPWPMRWACMCRRIYIQMYVNERGRVNSPAGVSPTNQTFVSSIIVPAHSEQGLVPARKQGFPQRMVRPPEPQHRSHPLPTRSENHQARLWRPGPRTRPAHPENLSHPAGGLYNDRAHTPDSNYESW
jgi:hypothetical protein